ncbi:hypothetical protein [Dulcicalothrix desertica]|nr:hypothetical protein [Dulcicalothrix desertica]TWH51339.1 hypothetical protein CAL7102_05744 [Dulcicalothrix desertica PCC 7102]
MYRYFPTQQEVFARYFLKKRGFNGLFRAKICLPSSQSGEQYVRTQYPAEVKAYRQNRNRVSIGLVMIIDADTSIPQERLDWLARALALDFQESRQPDEAIAIFVPKRNIETWIYWLQGETVNEEDPYSKFPNAEASCKPDVENLAEQCRSQNLPALARESLQLACGELQRLLELLKLRFAST